jgi:hypothetical protein
VLCARWLLEECVFEEHALAGAVESAAQTGSVLQLDGRLGSGATLTTAAPWPVPCRLLNSSRFWASWDPATLQWFVDRGFCVDSGFVRAAVHDSMLVQLEWAASVTNVAPFLSCELFCEATAPFKGRTECMEGLRARGCPWDFGVVTHAHLCRHEDCLVYALKHGCPVQEAVLRSYLAEMRLSELRPLVQALHDSGRSHLVDAAELFAGADAVSRKARQSGCCATWDFMRAADACNSGQDGQPLGYRAGSGCLRLLRRLCEKGLYTPGPADMRAALLHQHHQSVWAQSRGIVRWLHSQDVATHGPALALEMAFACGRVVRWGEGRLPPTGCVRAQTPREVTLKPSEARTQARRNHCPYYCSTRPAAATG